MKFKLNRYSAPISTILFIMATAFSFAVDSQQMNYLVIALLIFTPLIYLIQFPHFNKTNDTLLFLLILSIIISSLIHLSTFRITTIIYTTLYIIFFSYFIKLLRYSNLDINLYQNILRFILFSYFIIFVLQQLCVFFNLPFIINFIAGTIEDFKLNSLGPEPSHSARFVLISFLSIIMTKENLLGRKYDIAKDGRNDIFLWITFLYLMIFMGSGFAIVLLVIFFIRFFPSKIKREIFYIVPIIILALIVILNSDSEPVIRVRSFAEALFTSWDINKLMESDYSASVRIVPIFLYIQNFNLLNFHTLVGFGTDYTINLIPQYMAGVPYDSQVGGFFPAFFFDRGLIAALFVFMVIYKFCIIRFFSIDTLLLLLSIFEVGLNTQLFWFSILVYSINKYFFEKYNTDKTLLVKTLLN